MMKHFKRRLFGAGAIALAVAALGVWPSGAQDATKKDDQKKQSGRSSSRQTTSGTQSGTTTKGAQPGTTTKGATGNRSTTSGTSGSRSGTTPSSASSTSKGGATTGSSRSGTTTPSASTSKSAGTAPHTTATGKSATPPAPVANKAKAGKQETVRRTDGAQQTTKYSSTGLKQKEVVKAKDGTHTTQFSASGRPQKETVEKADGSKHTTEYGLNGHAKREEVVNRDGTKEVTTHQTGRDGVDRVHETVKVDARGVEVSKSVTIRNTTIINRTTIDRTTIVNDVVVRNYDRGRFGFVYRPEFLVVRPALVSWYDPYWYTPAGVVVVHPFHFAWGWEGFDWHRRYHGRYWTSYEVYPTPSYWVTDWLVAGYVADHFAVTLSVEQAREEARLAREEADRAREAAAAAELQATQEEIAAARQAQVLAAIKAGDAEKRIAIAERMEASAGQPNPNATPIDADTKEALKNQVEQAVAEKKQMADQAANGQAVTVDVTKALADPNHVYPVSKGVMVVNAKDDSPAGMVSEGDLLKLDPSQPANFDGATETTLIAMRVVTSKGEEGEVTAGTVVKVSLKDLQEFDSEFRAKLDAGLAEADKNKDLFKQGS